MTLYEGAILVLESAPDGQERKFRVLELSYTHRAIVDGKAEGPVTQLVRLEVLE